MLLGNIFMLIFCNVFEIFFCVLFYCWFWKYVCIDGKCDVGKCLFVWSLYCLIFIFYIVWVFRLCYILLVIIVYYKVNFYLSVLKIEIIWLFFLEGNLFFCWF